jgi:hypothetical protein
MTTTPDPAESAAQTVETPGTVEAPGTVETHTAPDTHGGHEEHSDGEPLGPIDWGAWAVSVVGIAAGLLIAVCLGVAANS